MKRSELDTSRLKPGDVILRGLGESQKNRNFRDIVTDTIFNVGAPATQGEFVHVLMYEGDGMAIESNDGGVKRLPITEAMKNAKSYGVLRGPKGTNVKKVIETVQGQIGEPYGLDRTWASGLSSVLPVPTIQKLHKKVDHKGPICSSLIAVAYEKAGTPIVSNIPSGIASPADIWKSKTLKPVMFEMEGKKPLFGRHTDRGSERYDARVTRYETRQNTRMLRQQAKESSLLRKLSELDASKLKPGDVILRGSSETPTQNALHALPNALFRVLAPASQGEFVHVLMYEGNGMALESNAESKGVARLSLADAMKGSKSYGVLRGPKGTDTKAIIKEVQDQIGQPYSMTRMAVSGLSSVLPVPTIDKLHKYLSQEGSICSSLIATAYEKAGTPIVNDIPASIAAPADIWKSKTLRPVMFEMKGKKPLFGRHTDQGNERYAIRVARRENRQAAKMIRHLKQSSMLSQFEGSDENLQHLVNSRPKPSGPALPVIGAGLGAVLGAIVSRKLQASALLSALGTAGTSAAGAGLGWGLANSPWASDIARGAGTEGRPYSWDVTAGEWDELKEEVAKRDWAHALEESGDVLTSGGLALLSNQGIDTPVVFPGHIAAKKYVHRRNLWEQMAKAYGTDFDTQALAFGSNFEREKKRGQILNYLKERAGRSLQLNPNAVPTELKKYDWPNTIG